MSHSLEDPITFVCASAAHAVESKELPLACRLRQPSARDRFVEIYNSVSQILEHATCRTICSAAMQETGQ